MSNDIYSALTNHIRNNVDISDDDLNYLCGFFKTRTIKKKDLLLRQGRICKFEGFVVHGCFRVFTIDDKGNENVLYFAVDGWWLMDIDSFLNQKKSVLNIQALEDSTILLISREDKLALYKSLPITERLFRIMSQKALVAWQQRVVRNQCLTAKERYEHFSATYPYIASKLTNKEIASYLGITHEFLSKLKNRL